MIHLNEKTLDAFMSRCEAAAICADGPVHIGRGNAKTGGINEGTLPLYTCDRSARATCGRSCYAVRMALRLPALFGHYAANTAARRRDPAAYYRAFFEEARRTGKFLRLNESGDFESVRQLRAAIAVAREFPDVVVITYTKRRNLLRTAATAPASFHVHFSCWTGDIAGERAAAAAGIPTASVSETRCTCPAQVAAAAGRTWKCADCARCGCGCASASPVVFKAH